MKPVLTILEGKWFPDRHVSIRDLFAPLFSVWTLKGDASYHYEQFTNEAAFRAAVRYSFKGNRSDTIYVGAHGNKKEIHGFHDEGISRTFIARSLNLEDGTARRGLYFGACSFCNQENADLILRKCRRVEWIAGYDSQVDWIDSSAIDLVFLRHFLFPTPGTGNKKPTTKLARLRYAAKRVCTDMAPLVERLGFHVYVRSGKKIEDLTAKADG